MSPDEGVRFLFLFMALAGAVWILRPVGKALARKLEGHRDEPHGGELEQVRNELLGEVDVLRQDVAQLSERLDFTERLLAKQQQAEQPRVGPGAR